MTVKSNIERKNQILYWNVKSKLHEKGVIDFTKEEQPDDMISVLDLKQKVRKTKTEQIEGTVHYKKTHMNINVKAKSSHPPYMKKGIIRVCRWSSSIV